MPHLHIPPIRFTNPVVQDQLLHPAMRRELVPASADLAGIQDVVRMSSKHECFIDDAIPEGRIKQEAAHLVEIQQKTVLGSRDAASDYLGRLHSWGFGF